MTMPQTTPLLWIGPLSTTRIAVRKYIADSVASCKGCTHCYFCRSLDDTSLTAVHSVPPYVMWLMPKDHGYVREQIDDALSVLTVELDTHEASAIVIQSADQLNSATANRLLKIIEEPPAGWHIILTTERLAEVLPTLRSRCIERYCDGDQDPESGAMVSSSSVIAWLENPRLVNWLEICGKMGELPRTVPATLAALDRLIAIWHARWVNQHDDRAQAMLAILTEMADRPPQSGGTNGFWRVLLLKVHQVLTA